jgi:chloride channel 3/4/5
MTAKWVGDALGKDGIYAVWIAMRRYPWLPPIHYRDKGETAAHVMRGVNELVTITDGVTTVKGLLAALKKYDYHGFPVIDRHGEYVGYTTRDVLQLAIGTFSLARCFLHFVLNIGLCGGTILVLASETFSSPLPFI